MPMNIRHIDAIAREKRRGVLFVEFRRSDFESGNAVAINYLARDWETLPVRQQVINWLGEHGIAWSPCGHFANEYLMMDYRGQIYIDVPFVLISTQT